MNEYVNPFTEIVNKAVLLFLNEGYITSKEAEELCKCNGHIRDKLYSTDIEGRFVYLKATLKLGGKWVVLCTIGDIYGNDDITYRVSQDHIITVEEC